ncbi:8741_t:CDS:2, partial [Paraglomus brasilianum]
MGPAIILDGFFDGYYSSPSTNPYPQRTDLESGSVPPTYENEPPATEPIAWHGQKHEAPAAAFEAGEKFTRDYPPQEKLPSDSDISYIINKGGAPAYRFELGPQVGTRQQPSVLNDGRLIQFHGKEDTMVQTNHPLFVPSLTADAISTTRDESSESSESKDVNYEKDKKN